MKLDACAVKTALDRCGGRKLDAARELRVSRQTLYNILGSEPELDDYASEIIEDIALATRLASAIRLGRISAEDRKQIHNILVRCLSSYAV